MSDWDGTCACGHDSGMHHATVDWQNPDYHDGQLWLSAMFCTGGLKRNCSCWQWRKAYPPETFTKETDAPKETTVGA